MANTDVARTDLRAGDAAPVLLAISDASRAGRLALACTERKLLPALAFSTDDVTEFIRGSNFDLVLLGLWPNRAEVGAFVTSIRRFGDPTVVLLDREELPNPALAELGVLASIDANASDAEIASRAAALLALERRGRPLEPLRWGPLELDVPRREARWSGALIDVTPIQFKLLLALARAEGAVRSRDQLAEIIWGSVPADDGERVVAHIRRIRSKIEADPSHPAFLLTARGEGFRLADPTALDERAAGPWAGRDRRRGDRRHADRRTPGSGAVRPLRGEEVLQAVRPIAAPEVQAAKRRA